MSTDIDRLEREVDAVLRKINALAEARHRVTVESDDGAVDDTWSVGADNGQDDEADEGTSNITADDRYVLFGEQGLHEFLCWLGELFSIKTPELKRVTIIAAMYGTFIANEKEAQKFWGQVARGGVEYEDTAPATVLDAWLKSVVEDRRNAEKLLPGNFYQGCIYAWNAFRDSRAITAIKYKTEKGLYQIAQ